jgi:phospholipase C
LAPIGLAHVFDIDHSAAAMFADCNGAGKLPGTKCRMNGFDRERTSGGPKGIKYPVYSYVPHRETKPYFDMAHEWVLADRTFQSQLDESFVAHQYVIAAQAQSSVNIPYGPWGCEPGPGDFVATINRDRTLGNNELPCFDYQTLGDELDEAGLTWRFYSSWYKGAGDTSAIWSSYQGVKHIYEGPDWAKVITPQRRFLTDVAAGKLAAFTWITPLCKNSDHTDCGGGDGPSWVTAVVNAVGESKFWDSTVIFVQWDDWGGLYDPAPPPYKDYDGLGFRVPLIVISAYAKQNYVSHVQYETASVLRFAEDLFGLGQLASADRRAVSPAADCFDFSQKPRRFEPIKAPKDAAFFLREPLDYRIPDSQ